MSMEKLLKEKEKLDEKIAKLESMSTEKVKREGFGEAMLTSLEAVPEMLPAAFLPAMVGVMLYSDAMECETKAQRIAMCALSTPLAVPCIAITAVLALPVAAIAIPTGAAIGGVNAARTAAVNKRIDKLPKAIEKLKDKRAQLEEQIAVEKARQTNKR